MRHLGPVRDLRSSALWGKGGRTGAAGVALAALLAAPVAATASAQASGPRAFVPGALVATAAARPDGRFDVVVVGDGARAVAQEVGEAHGRSKRAFASIPGVAATVSGRALLALARSPHVAAITPDTELRAAAYEDATMWRSAVDGLGTPSSSGAAPAIAVVDSGIQDRKEFPHLLAHVNLSSTSSAPGQDPEGHGTMVAGIAGANGKYGGAAQTFPLLDVRTADENGMSLTSDVIAACDWILRNKARYNIRVANFSMSGGVESSFASDPLDRAVERLWLSGIVVVAAAGNQGTGTGPVPIGAPANDPFVITVGATDLHSSVTTADDTVPWWSAYGPTRDGFEKPELSAPGRYLVGPVPAASTLAQAFPDRIVDSGPSMWMSGTSFAAPVVAGAAAQVLLRHPDWSPGRVKGALMVTARPLRLAGPAAGVGELDVAGAANLATAPNANENLDAFVTTDGSEPVFDRAGWAAAVAADANWSSANWSSAGWSSASWSIANWSEASWSEANWSEASWSSAGWAVGVGAGASWSE